MGSSRPMPRSKMDYSTVENDTTNASPLQKNTASVVMAVPLLFSSLHCRVNFSCTFFKSKKICSTTKSASAASPLQR